MAKMRNTAVALALALAASACNPSTAGAQPVPPVQPGPWSASGGRSADGRPMCALSALGAGGRSLQLEYVRGERRIVVRAARASWGIPAGARIPVHLFVDAALGWSAGSGRTRRDATGIEWSIGLDELGRFEALFRSGTRITLDFPEGYEAPWRFGLAGADAMMDRFARCIGAINEADATPPHAGGAGSGSGRSG